MLLLLLIKKCFAADQNGADAVRGLQRLLQTRQECGRAPGKRSLSGCDWRPAVTPGKATTLLGPDQVACVPTLGRSRAPGRAWQHVLRPRKPWARPSLTTRARTSKEPCATPVFRHIAALFCFRFCCFLFRDPRSLPPSLRAVARQQSRAPGGPSESCTPLLGWT